MKQKRKPVNEIAGYQIAINQAQDWYRLGLDRPDARKALPYLATSNFADVWLITAWLLHWYGSVPEFVHKSRGYTWAIGTPRDFTGNVMVSNPYDHINGVKIV